MSTWMSANLYGGRDRSLRCGVMCLVTLDVWHFWHFSDQIVASRDILCETNFVSGTWLLILQRGETGQG